MEQFKQLVLSWFRAAAAAAVAIYLTGETNPKTLGAAALAGAAVTVPATSTAARRESVTLRNMKNLR
jgi:hypothetical protein